MTTDQEADDLAASVRHAMTQRGREIDQLRAMNVALSNDVGQARHERDQAEAACDALEDAARAVVDSAARELNYSEAVVLVDTAALRALERCVSQKEETRG